MQMIQSNCWQPNVTLTLQPAFNAVAGGIRGTGSISILVTEDPSVAFSR